MARFASLTSCTDNYVPYLMAQLNSMNHYGNHTHDAHVVMLDVPDNVLQKIDNQSWKFNLILHCDSLKNYQQYPNKNLQSKKARYHAIKKYCMDYEAFLFLDADLMIVADITPFFHMVRDTKTIIGVNERFKWNLSRYSLNGTSLPNKEMSWMICNAPTFFDPRHHILLIDQLIETSTKLIEIEKEKTPSDLFTMNVAIYLAGDEENVVMLPHYLWTQTHHSLEKKGMAIRKHNNGWRAWTNEKVYTIHGRWLNRTDFPHIKKEFERWATLEVRSNG